MIERWVTYSRHIVIYQLSEGKKKDLTVVAFNSLPLEEKGKSLHLVENLTNDCKGEWILHFQPSPLDSPSVLVSELCVVIPSEGVEAEAGPGDPPRLRRRGPRLAPNLTLPKLPRFMLIMVHKIYSFTYQDYGQL